MQKIPLLIAIGCLLLTIARSQGAVNTLTISGGTRLHSSGSAFVVLQSSDLVNNGDLQMGDAGTVVFTGIKNTRLSGKGYNQLDNLWVRLGSADTLDIQSDLHIAKEVNFSGGQLNLNNSAILLGGKN